MNSGPAARAALFLAAASSAAALVSIAASQILLGAAIVALYFCHGRLRIPSVWIPLALFMAGTAISLVLSAEPAAGLPQIRKFYVYLTLPVLYSAVRAVAEARALVLVWAATASAGALDGVIQFIRMAHEAQRAGRGLYEYYVGARITGFMSHWQTFGGEQMIVLLMLVAFLMYSPRARRLTLWLGLGGVALLGAALLLGYTRGVWVGAAAGVLYLIWVREKRLLIAVPVLVAAILWLNPGAVRTRIESSFHPDQRLDSNEFRIVCWRTGWQMIKAHPLVGVGPEIVRLRFNDWVPADIPRPLPTGWYGHLHNLYIHYAAERGIPTALALVAALVMMVCQFAGALRRLKPGQGDERFLLHGAIAVIAAVMISGMFEVNLGDSEVLAIFLSVAALAYVARASVAAGAESHA